MDVLTDIKQAMEKAIENGETLESFKKNLTPLLQEKGWWGKKEMVDPLTGKTVNAQLGSDRRLKTIYDTNTRSAYQQGRWERTQASTAHPYLMYRVGPSKNHRKEHLQWDGLVLPKDDPWWNSHYPPNGWGCKCWTMAVSEERKQRLEETGIKVPPSTGGEPGYTVPVKTKAPPNQYKTFVNERKGTVERVPVGVDPAFNWNVGKKGRNEDALREKIENSKKILFGNTAEFSPVPMPMSSKGIQEIQNQSNAVYSHFTANEIRSIGQYTQGKADKINRYLQAGSQGIAHSSYAKDVKNLDNAIDKFKLDRDIVTFRGTDAAYYKGLAIGDVFKEKVYYSTSAEEKIAKEMAKQNQTPIMAEIRVPKGSKGLYIGDNTEYSKDQSEFLLKRGTKYLVIGKNVSYIILEVINE
jgi:SPP1 gp7 family putative phage head morphogenesis protein